MREKLRQIAQQKENEVVDRSEALADLLEVDETLVGVINWDDSLLVSEKKIQVEKLNNF